MLSDVDLTQHNRAVGLMGQYRYAAAMTELAALVENNPDNLDLQIDLAIAILNRQQAGDEAKALTQLTAILEYSAHKPRVHYLSGLLELNAGALDQAVQHFTWVVKVDPDDAYASYYLALSLAQLGQVETALRWYQKTIELDPYLRSGYYGAFQTLRKLGHADQARDMLDRYQKMARNPRSHQAEFKYTRMGPKAEVRTFNLGHFKVNAKPKGPLFKQPLVLLDELRFANPQSRPTITTADINHDSYLDLFISSSHADENQINTVLLGHSDGGFTPALDHPLTGIPGINAVLWGDIDNDGLLDLYLCRNGPNQHWQQTLAGSWQNVSTPVTSNGNWNTRDGALFDADHDGDLDIFLVNGDGPNELLNNNLNGSFRALAAEVGLSGSDSDSRSVVLTDLDRDRDTDILVINDKGEHEVYLNDLLWRYQAAPGFDLFKSIPTVAALATDRNADGIPELYSLSEQGQVSRWQADALGIWQPTTLMSKADFKADRNSRMALLDINGDGTSELLRTTTGGWTVFHIEDKQLSPVSTAEKPDLLTWIPFNNQVSSGPSVVALSQQGQLLYWQTGKGRYPFIGLNFRGKNKAEHSMRSNASGIGTHAAVRVGDRWSAISAFRQSSGPGQSLQPYTIGLGGADRADFIALEWSDGVFQTELDVATGQLHTISETQRQLASCPVLFAWDGQRYRFISDILGVGGLGFETGYGEYAEPRPRENLQLPGGLLQARKGLFMLSLGEPMEEAAYLDQARLTSYDLPPGWQLVLDERSAILGPQASGEPRFYRTELSPISAINDQQENVTASILAADLKAAPVGNLDSRFIGLLEKQHSLTLAFAQTLDTPVGEPMLVIDGWIEYPYSQTMFAAWQAGAPYLAPSIDAQGEDGEWVILMDQFGYPAGMPRRMSVPLGKLPKGTQKLRLRTNQEIYWDRITVAYSELPTDVRRHSYPFEIATLRNNGFPKRSTGPQRLPNYDYDQSNPFWDTRHMTGFYTEFGDVTELIAAKDDALVIIGPGETVELAFKDTANTLEESWSRTFIFESFGWAKDMDLYTKDGSTVGPLPSNHNDPIERERLHRQYNTRYRSGH